MGVKFEQVTKLYSGGGRPAVKDLSLEVQTGELLVLIGPSGCGKTTRECCRGSLILFLVKQTYGMRQHGEMDPRSRKKRKRQTVCCSD